MSDRIKNLLIDPNCLFHGSPVAGLEKIEPKPATDVDSANGFNNDLAVFASHDLRFCIPFSLMNCKALPEDIGNFEWSVGCPDNEGEFPEVHVEIPEKLRDFIEQATGTLYVLPKAGFTETSGLQWKNRSAVTPLQAIEVTLQDFYDAGGIIKWAPGS